MGNSVNIIMNFMFSRDTNKEHVIHLKSDNIEIMTDDEAD